MSERIYTASSTLRRPRLFLRDVRNDLRVVSHIGWQLFRRNLRGQMRRSFLGYLWILLPPIMNGLVWIYLGKVRILNVEGLPVPYPVFVLTGLFLWQGFVEAFNCPLQQLQGARNTIAKVRIPHEAFVVSGFAGVLLNMAIRLVILAGILIWFGIPFHTTLLVAPIGLASLLLLGFALGWLVAPMGMLYSDVSNAIGMMMGLWFLVTPIVYTPPASVAHLIAMNPVTPLLTTTRDWILLGHLTPAPGFGLTVLVSILILGIGWVAYRLAQPHLIVRM
ncbi:ABC transporter permease [Larkinella sp. VNQ87]